MKISTTMKKILLLIGILVSITAVQVVFGQAEGVILYAVKVNIHRGLPPAREAMKSQIPEFRTSKTQLVFNSAESLYKPVIEEEEDDINNGEGMRMRFRQPLSEVYINQSESKRVLLQD